MKKRLSLYSTAGIFTPARDNHGRKDGGGIAMHEANGYVYLGSLEAAARFGGRLGLRQQAELREEHGPGGGSFEEHLERMADPAPPASTAEGRPDLKSVQWGRCGMIPSQF